MDDEKMDDIISQLAAIQKYNTMTSVDEEEPEPTEHEIVVKILGHIVSELHQIREAIDSGNKHSTDTASPL